MAISGASFELSSTAALSLAMLLNELCTNAVKHGAWSREGGIIDISWTNEGSAFRFRWVERDGPAVTEPARRGFISAYLGDLLRDAGYDVVNAANAAEAIAILERRSDIRLVITDINMPGSMDGLRLANAVRGRWPPIKIIVATGQRRPADHRMPQGSLFLPKPYDPSAVIAAVQRLL